MFTQMTVLKVSGTQNATKGHECGNEPWEKKGSEQEWEPERTGRAYFSQNSLCRKSLVRGREVSMSGSQRQLEGLTSVRVQFMYVESCQNCFH